MPSHLSVEQILSDSSDRQDASLYDFGENENEKLLLDEAEQSYNRMVDAITSNCINGMPNDTESPSQILSDIQDSKLSVGHSREIFDTKDLSELNFVYNDITLQVFPTLKIPNDRSNRTDILPREDELATKFL
jgi:hypothetical protein